MLLLAMLLGCSEAVPTSEGTEALTVPLVSGTLMQLGDELRFRPCQQTEALPVTVSEPLEVELRGAFAAFENAAERQAHDGTFAGVVADGRVELADWYRLELGAGGSCRDSAPVTTLGVGTEPTWSLSIEGERARFHMNERPLTEYRVESTTRSNDEGQIVVVLTREGERARVVFTRMPTNDGMGDTLYPYDVTFRGFSGTGTVAPVELSRLDQRLPNF